MPMFNGRQVDRMRQDAIRRSQEMYRKSVSENLPPTDIAETPPVPQTVQPETNLINMDKPQENFHNDLFKGLFGDNLDSDKLLIAALLFLLVKEGADLKLIIALGYILL